MPLEMLSADLQSNEMLKDFGSADDLAKSFIDIKTRTSSGDMSLLPEDLRKDPSLANFKTVGDVAKSYIETKKLVGTIKRAPEKADAYKFSNVEGLHPSVKTTDGFQTYLRSEAHKLGLAEDQADGVHKLALGYISQLTQANEKAREENRQKNETALKQDWGADYDKNFNGVVRMITSAGGKEAEAVMAEVAETLKGRPLALKAFSKIANLLSEDSINSLGSGVQTGVEGDEKEFVEMSEAIRKNDSKHPLMNERDPKHQEAKERWSKLSLAHFSK